MEAQTYAGLEWTLSLKIRAWGQRETLQWLDSEEVLAVRAQRGAGL